MTPTAQIIAATQRFLATPKPIHPVVRSMAEEWLERNLTKQENE